MAINQSINQTLFIKHIYNNQLADQSAVQVRAIQKTGVKTEQKTKTTKVNSKTTTVIGTCTCTYTYVHMYTHAYTRRYTQKKNRILIKGQRKKVSFKKGQ